VKFPLPKPQKCSFYRYCRRTCNISVDLLDICHKENPQRIHDCTDLVDKHCKLVERIPSAFDEHQIQENQDLRMEMAVKGAFRFP